MTKLNMILAIVLMASALALVTSQHKTRSLIAALESQQEIAHQLDVGWEQLLLEQRTQANHEHIERIAKTKLNMQALDATREQIVHVKHPVAKTNSDYLTKP